MALRDKLTCAGSRVQAGRAHYSTYVTEETRRPGTDSPNHDKPGETIGLALSGGGSRAALYSLGVLLYLVHSKLNEEVRLISSVSGGSIVNAALSVTEDYSRVSPPDFDKIAGRLANRLANRGVFFVGRWRDLPLGLLFVLGVGLVGATCIALFTGQEPDRDRVYAALPFLIGIALGGISSLLWVLFNRGSRQIAAYADLISRFRQEEKRLRPRSQLKLSEVNDSTRVRHVLCATELTSGRPIYMDRREIRSPAYGSGDPNLSLAKAIYASAAFPVGFPPLRVKTASLNMSGGDTEERPPWLLLSDGGVFNNLGTDSFTAWSTWDPFMPDQRFADWPWPTITRRIIVNASSPARVARMPRLWIWRNIVIAQRIMAVLYENTLRPRILALLAEEEESDDPIIIDIANSPIAILERQISGKSRGDDAHKRAQDTLDKLRRFQHTAYWHEYSVRASATKTVLLAIGQTAAVRLLRLGYLDAAITCHVRLNSAGLETVPSEAWFQELVRDIDDSLNRSRWRIWRNVGQKEPAGPKTASRHSSDNEPNDLVEPLH